MKKRMKKKKDCNFECKCTKTLGLLSTGALGASLFMGYNRLTGNVIYAISDVPIVSFGGIALFVLGLLGVFLVAREN